MAGGGREAIFGICRDGDGGALAALLAPGGVPLDVTLDRFGRSPLMVAAEFGRTGIIPMLLERGATVDFMPRGRTALHQAAYHSPNAETVGALVCAGADVNLPDDESHHALICAVYNAAFGRMTDEVTAEKVRLLLAAGADPGYTDITGATAFALVGATRLTRTAAVLRHFAG